MNQKLVIATVVLVVLSGLTVWSANMSGADPAIAPVASPDQATEFVAELRSTAVRRVFVVDAKGRTPLPTAEVVQVSHGRLSATRPGAAAAWR